ncbi:MAG: Mg2+ and Co2+ transporter CorB [Eubacteriales bacterium]
MSEQSDRRKRRKSFDIKNSAGIRRVNLRWIVTVTLCAFFLSMMISLGSTVAMSGVESLWVALLVLLAIVSIGILFDIIGVAIQAAEEKPFHSMASRKVRGASQAIFLIRNAEKMSSFCNDVVGDIAGIISGSTVAVVLVFFTQMLQNIHETIISLVLTALVSALTIGGKALGKTFAMNNANTVVYVVGYLASLVAGAGSWLKKCCKKR